MPNVAIFVFFNKKSPSRHDVINQRETQYELDYGVLYEERLESSHITWVGDM
jgi:hypothetical protein